MKKLLALALMGTLTLSVFGQGTVQFNNKVSSAGVNAPVSYNPGTGAVLVDGATYPDIRAALVGGPTTATAVTQDTQGNVNLGSVSLLGAPSDANLTWTTFRSGVAAGYVQPGADTARAVTGVDFGGQALVQMVGWKGAYDTFSAAVAAGAPIGFSNPITVTLPSSPTSTDQTYLVGMQGFTITSTVPEPTSFALAGLGAAALLIFRRKK